MNVTLTEDDAVWLDRIHATLEQADWNYSQKGYQCRDYNRLGCLIAQLRGEYNPDDEQKPFKLPITP